MSTTREAGGVSAECKECELLLIGDPLRLTLYRTALSELGAAELAVRATTLPLADAIVAGQERLLEQFVASK